ncbi:uncharacterized protein [Macrobrachium rosenbergii]|uniref:uncharacterized protein n=1 Tax=Macrobrachium rosenbergii TaxID=79674 RepID=UPI0034D4D4B2
MPDEKPSCFKCWGIGHILRYCAISEKCAFCAAEHDSRTCPHRHPVPPTLVDTASASASNSLPLPALDTSHWKCLRCEESGVNVWHGCARRSRTASNQHVAQPLPLPSIPPPVAASSQVSTLRNAVEVLKSRCDSLTSRFEAIESRLERMDTRIDSLVASFDNLTSKFATKNIMLQSLVEAQQAVITSVTSLTEKLDSLATRLESVTNPHGGPLPCDGPPIHARVTTASSFGHRPLKKHVR